MTKILILSDSHGDLWRIKRILDIEQDFDAVFHLGDLVRDAGFIAKTIRKPVYYVKGNCDGVAKGDYEKTLTIEDVTMTLLHGHRYEVKSSPLTLYLLAKEKGVNIVFFGHTHEPFLQEEDGITLCNPGALSRPRGGYGESYATMIIDGDRFYIDIKTFPHKTPTKETKKIVKKTQ